MISDYHKNHQLIMDVCQSVGLPSDGWTFWIPAYYKKNSGELDVPETWKRIKEGSSDYTAYIRPGRDIRIRDCLVKGDYLVEVLLNGEA